MSFSHRNDGQAFGGARAVLAFTFSAGRMPATCKLTLFVVLAIFPLIAGAADITLQGTFTADDDVQLFSVSVAAPATVDIRSYGYAGGTTSTGTTVPPGGFDSILTLFSASGTFLSENDDGAGVATDPSTGMVGDARITTSLTPGSYLLALTQYDNFSKGNLADGFVETGHPNFTADSSFATGGPCPGNMFRDISGTAGRCRNGNWTVDFTNVASVTPVAPVPEPSTAGLLGLSLLGFAWIVGRKKPHRSKLLSVLLPVLTLGVWNAEAQTSANPDYSNVDDILKGQRNLYQVQDLQFVTVDPSLGPVFYQVKTANSSQATPTSFQYGLQGIDSTKPTQSFSAHMFNQSAATTITTLHKFNGAFALWLQGIASSSGISAWTPLAQGDEPDVNCGAVADFTQDGFDDLALGLADGRILVVSPNSTDPSAQPFTGSFHSTTPITTLNVLTAMAAGDFNGDGLQELAGLTVLPSGGLELVIYTIDPKSLAVTAAATLTLTTPGASTNTPIVKTSMARGRFTNTTHDQLAVAFATNSGNAYVEVIDFATGTLTPSEASPLPAFTPDSAVFSGGYIQVKTGQFNQTNNYSNNPSTISYDSIVYHSSSPTGNGRYFEVLKVDPTSFTVTGTTAVGYNAYPCAMGIDVGNFDHQQPDPANPGKNEHDPNSQIAFMYCGPSSGNPGLVMNIYSVDPSSLNVNQNPDSLLILPVAFSSQPSFVPTDLQGRSYILGPPAKVVLNGSTQPSAVVAMPPMHVDWVAPISSQTPEVLNVSAAPHGFKTFYDLDTSKGDESSTSDATSFSFGAKETVGGSFSIGDVDEGEGLQVKDVFTATQDLKKSVQNESGTTHQESFKLDTATVFGDEVLYTDSRFNIWVYPVLGQTVCSATKSPCPPNEKVPMTVQLSAPDGTTSYAGSGKDMEWYQPPWEPLNVLSYPANWQQLQAIYPNTQQIATTTAAFTDQSQLTQQVTWTSNSTASQTASFDENNSYENDLSVTGAVSFGEVGFGFEGGVDISGSQGFSTLNKSVTSYSSSIGLGVSYLGSVLDPSNYLYAFAPVIFSSTPPTGAVDSSPLNTGVQEYGLIRTAFTADPTISNAGGWWQRAYNMPDVALNRPAHWVLTASGESGDNCLANGSGGSQFDCFNLGTSNPGDPWNSEVHFMRGFFISNQAHPGQGPQLSLATAGDQLTLQARVYNYSLTPMPDNTTVYVHFYAQPLDSTNKPTGNSIYIGEAQLKNGIPAFGNTDNALNWTLAQVPFDTTPYGGKTVAFWVVVWMQGQDGKLVPEMPGHGLKAIPGTLNSLADVQTEDYSNNVGFYKMAFPILTSPSPSPSGLLGASPSSSPVPVNSSPVPTNIGKIGLSATQVMLNQPITVSAPLSVPSSSAQGFTAQFYDGDPKNGGKSFDIERIAYLEANQGRDATVIYRPSSCGTHELFVVVNKGRPDEVVRRAPPVRVECTQSMLRMGSAGQRLNLK